MTAAGRALPVHRTEIDVGVDPGDRIPPSDEALRPFGEEELATGEVVEEPLRPAGAIAGRGSAGRWRPVRVAKVRRENTAG